MASFPNIRAPLAAGWSSLEQDSVRRTPMDSGNPKLRGDSTAGGQDERFRFKLDQTERDTLWAFYKANKALRFDIDEHWAWGVPCQAIFLAPITWSRDGRWWIADVPMKLWPSEGEE